MPLRAPFQANLDPDDDEAADAEAMAEYQARGGVSHEAILAWVDSWGDENELPPPKIGD